jgi:hypothetical protein
MQPKTQNGNKFDSGKSEEMGYWLDSTGWALESLTPGKMSSFSTPVVYSYDKEMG